MPKKTSYNGDFKFKVSLEAIKGEKTYEEIATEYGIAKLLISKWRDELIKNGSSVYGKESKSKDHEQVEQKLYQQIGAILSHFRGKGALQGINLNTM